MLLPRPEHCKHRIETWVDVWNQAEWVAHEGVPVRYDLWDLRNFDQTAYDLRRDTRDICYALRWPTPQDIEALFDTEGDYS